MDHDPDVLHDSADHDHHADHLHDDHHGVGHEASPDHVQDAAGHHGHLDPAHADLLPGSGPDHVVGGHGEDAGETADLHEVGGHGPHEVHFGGYSNADGTYHSDADNTDRDPETGKIVRQW